VPIYEYECTSCGERLEKLQKVSDAPLSDCPACGQTALQKLVSAAAFHLKGSGWYVTDFKDKPAKKEKKSVDSQQAKSEAKSQPASKKPETTK